jgi:hypothetical protein
MPRIGKKEYPYTQEGMAAAEAARAASSPAPTGRGATAPETLALTDTALTGELGALDRPDGGQSTELSITIPIGTKGRERFVNIPLLVEGQVNVAGLLRGEKPSVEQEEIAIERAMERVEGGAALPEYDTPEEAGGVAQRRSDLKAQRGRQTNGY